MVDQNGSGIGRKIIVQTRASVFATLSGPIVDGVKGGRFNGHLIRANAIFFHRPIDDLISRNICRPERVVIQSKKGHDLATHPFAALTFHWVELERQIRIEGSVERVAEADSDAYFQIRPIKSRLGAIASAQSQPIDSREHLEEKFAQAEAQYGDTPPPRPAHWGGYRLKPTWIEFWQGRRSRLHDRIVYTLEDDGQWSRQRLQP